MKLSSPSKSHRKAATARARGFSIFTEADSMDELKKMIRDAVSCYFEGGQKPRVIRLHIN